ncbi:3'-5' exoribonuclease YhaM [Paraliobacillus sp. PM-2]|uniref:HD domain-containing protein n=1 Tax=Paraliobacillus sp. PM-2 TaxID=1462524 RepID=UPI00061C5BBB|nr:HD domain-containing protein [Paraliobacillus sp. PM-2]CQR47049.1 3'-5' exoribonuclease YhaM [Paraliobacillus sp. PM-2]
MVKQDHYFYQFIPITYQLKEEERQQILKQFPTPSFPEGNHFFSIQDKAKGDPVNELLLLNESDIKLTKTNKQFLKMTFSNNTGMIHAKMWDNNGNIDEVQNMLNNHNVFHVQGVVDDFKGNKSITVNQIEPETKQINPFSLLPYTNQHLEELTLELFAYIYELEEPYQSICLKAMEELWQDFSLAPAAKGFHHNYLGGLLKHTIGLMRFTRYIIKFETNPIQAIIKLISVVEKAYKNELYQSFQVASPINLVWKDSVDHLYSMLQGIKEFQEDQLNFDLLITSILFHDLGKICEYDYISRSAKAFELLYPTAELTDYNKRNQAGIAMDPLGVMIGHIPYGVLLLNKIIEIKHIRIPLRLIHEMSHCILCHHGLPEWGAAVRKPQSFEGYLIHIVDYLDSRYENTEIVK